MDLFGTVTMMTTITHSPDPNSDFADNNADTPLPPPTKSTIKNFRKILKPKLNINLISKLKY